MAVRSPAFRRRSRVARIVRAGYVGHGITSPSGGIPLEGGTTNALAHPPVAPGSGIARVPGVFRNQRLSRWESGSTLEPLTYSLQPTGLRKQRRHIHHRQQVILSADFPAFRTHPESTPYEHAGRPWSWAGRTRAGTTRPAGLRSRSSSSLRNMAQRSIHAMSISRSSGARCLPQRLLVHRFGDQPALGRKISSTAAACRSVWPACWARRRSRSGR